MVENETNLLHPSCDSGDNTYAASFGKAPMS